MAVQNDPRLYSAGAVVFDSSPSTNLYGNLLQRRQAKMDALDEYDKQRINSINPNGVRDKDREGFDSRINSLRTFYQENKDKIRQAGTAESFNYEKMFRDLSSYINQSKERTAKQDAAMKFYQDKLKQDGVVPDEYMTDLELNDRGLDEEESQSFDLKRWLSMPKTYDREKTNKPYNAIKRTPGQPFTEPIEGNNLRVNEVVEEKFDNAAIEQIQFMSASDFENIYSFREQVKKEVEDPVKRVEMAETFKKIKGVDPASMDDYAFAYKMQELQPTVRKVRQIDNKEAIMDKQQAQRQANIRLASSLGFGSWKDKYDYNAWALREGVKENEQTAGNTITQGTSTDGSLNISPALLGIPDYAKKVRVTNNGKDITYDVNIFDKDGKVERTDTKTITRESAEKFMSNKLDLRVVPKVQPKTTTTTNKPKKKYNPATGRFE